MLENSDKWPPRLKMATLALPTALASPFSICHEIWKYLNITHGEQRSICTTHPGFCSSNLCFEDLGVILGTWRWAREHWNKHSSQFSSSAFLPTLLPAPPQIEISHHSCTLRSPHAAGLGLLPSSHISLLKDRERQQCSQVLHKNYRLKGPKHVLHLQSQDLFQVNTLNSNSQTRSLHSIVWPPAFPKAFNRTEATGIAWRFT